MSCQLNASEVDRRGPDDRISNRVVVAHVELAVVELDDLPPSAAPRRDADSPRRARACQPCPGRQASGPRLQRPQSRARAASVAISPRPSAPLFLDVPMPSPFRSAHKPGTKAADAAAPSTLGRTVWLQRGMTLPRSGSAHHPSGERAGLRTPGYGFRRCRAAPSSPPWWDCPWRALVAAAAVAWWPGSLPDPLPTPDDPGAARPGALAADRDHGGRRGSGRRPVRARSRPRSAMSAKARSSFMPSGPTSAATGASRSASTSVTAPTSELVTPGEDGLRRPRPRALARPDRRLVLAHPPGVERGPPPLLEGGVTASSTRPGSSTSRRTRPSRPPSASKTATATLDARARDGPLARLRRPVPLDAARPAAPRQRARGRRLPPLGRRRSERLVPRGERGQQPHVGRSPPDADRLAATRRRS